MPGVPPVFVRQLPSATQESTIPLIPQPAAGWSWQTDPDVLEEEWLWTARLATKGPVEARVTLHDDAIVLRVKGDVGGGRIGFWQRSGNRLVPLGQPQVALKSLTGQLTIVRNAWRIQALWDGRLVVTAWSDRQGGHLGYGTRGQGNLAPPRLQPTEPLLFTDDFMRQESEGTAALSSSWRQYGGVWGTTSLARRGVQSPNPFVLSATVARTVDNGIALATVEKKWFWTDYTVAASVRGVLADASQPLCAAVVAYSMPEGQHVAGELDFRSGQARILAAGQVMGTSTPFYVNPNGWHRLFLDPGPGVLRLLVDGIERVRILARSERTDLCQGTAGLRATLGSANRVDFDDVKVEGQSAFDDDFKTPAPGLWQARNGQWHWSPGELQQTGTSTGMVLAGGVLPDNGRVEATVRGDGGIVFALNDTDHLAAEVSDGVLQIIQHTAENSLVLARQPLPHPDPFRRLAVSWREGVVTFTSDDQELQAATSQVLTGRCGVQLAAGSAVTAFRALATPVPWGEPPLPERFRKDRLMKFWASEGGFWHADPARADSGSVHWHSGDFLKDAAVVMPLPPAVPGARFAVSLGADPAEVTAGARLSGQAEDGVWLLTLQEGTHVLGRVRWTPTGADMLRLVRFPLAAQAVLVRLAINGKVQIAEKAARAGQGVKVAVDLPPPLDANFDWDAVHAVTGYLLDYAFTAAPVDWTPARGLWEVNERWTCDPEWSFFSGGDAVVPTLWSRLRPVGDYTVEAYLASPMDQTRGERSPVDLNLTAEGNGLELASGYSFLFAARGRTANCIYRGDQLVWEKPFVGVPGIGDPHQAWYTVRLERRLTGSGLRFRWSVNGILLGEYLDAHPLPDARAGGRLAFWSHHGGLAVARVRLWHEGLRHGEEPSPELPLPDALPAWKNPLGTWSVRTQSGRPVSALLEVTNDEGRRAMRVTNPASGGDWTLYATRTPFDAAQHPLLQFAYRIPAGVLINCYCLVDGRWREIRISGVPPREPTAAESIATAAITVAGSGPLAGGGVDPSVVIGVLPGHQADGKWHHAKIDLLGLLQRAHLTTHVEALAFAAPAYDYIQAGLGGNHRGAWYLLSDFAG